MLSRMETFSEHLRQEAASLRSRLGGMKGLLIHVALIGVFGVFLPWKRGIEFLDPVMLSAYACLGVLFAAPTAAQAFADSRPTSIIAAIARISVAVLYGECIVAAFLLSGIATVYATHRHSFFFAPDLAGLAMAGLLGLTASFAFASVAAWITLRFSATAARGALRVMFLLLLFVYFFRAQWLPDVAGLGVLLCLVVAAAAVFGVRALVK